MCPGPMLPLPRTFPSRRRPVFMKKYHVLLSFLRCAVSGTVGQVSESLEVIEHSKKMHLPLRTMLCKYRMQHPLYRCQCSFLVHVGGPQDKGLDSVPVR